MSGGELLEKMLHDPRSAGKLDVNALNAQGDSPLHVAIVWGNPRLMRVLFNYHKTNVTVKEQAKQYKKLVPSILRTSEMKLNVLFNKFTVLWLLPELASGLIIHFLAI